MGLGALAVSACGAGGAGGSACGAGELGGQFPRGWGCWQSVPVGLEGRGVSAPGWAVCLGAGPVLQNRIHHSARLA